jgi:nucleotide-binding universal stress UspA family protein
MRRVLVPLDGSSLAASILPDARQLAGEGGELILIRDPIGSVGGRAGLAPSAAEALQEVLIDLEAQAALLRDQGVTVETHALVMIDPAYAIGTATHIYGADMVACATHGRGPSGRLVRGGVAWRALADSPVPVLIRHADADAESQSIVARKGRILVPLDGSTNAEKALPLAQELAQEWQSEVWLVHVVAHFPITELPQTGIAPDAATDRQAEQEARAYLDSLAAHLSGEVHIHVLFGSVSERLINAAQAWDVSHIVMTSHGRTGWSRVLLGSVADALIEHLHCPIIVIPSRAAEAIGRSAVEQETHFNLTGQTGRNE